MAIVSTELVSFVNSTSVKEADNLIAKKAGCKIYDQNRDIIIPFYASEIDESELSIVRINEFITHNKKVIADFGSELLKNVKEKSISFGVSISYSIYLIYLKEKTNEALIEYINRRRIPNSEKFVKRLVKVAKGIKYEVSEESPVKGKFDVIKKRV